MGAVSSGTFYGGCSVCSDLPWVFGLGFETMVCIDRLELSKQNRGKSRNGKIVENRGMWFSLRFYKSKQTPVHRTNSWKSRNAFELFSIII